MKKIGKTKVTSDENYFRTKASSSLNGTFFSTEV